MSLWDKFKNAIGGSGFGGGGGGGRLGGTSTPNDYRSGASGMLGQETLNQVADGKAKNEQYLRDLAKSSIGGSSGGYGGGGGYISGPNMSNIGSGLTAPKAPDRVTYDNLGKDLQALYDQFGYYTPDWDKLDKSQEDLMGVFGEQRENIKGEFDIAKGDLQTSFDRSMAAQERGQDYRRRDFADARRQLTEDAYMSSRDLEAGAASRGLGESGVKEMAQIQGRMAMGQGMSNYAEQYYQMEEEATQAINYAREDYETTQVKLQQTLQSALTDIAGAEVMTANQYTDKIEQMKRQLSADQSAVAQAKQNFLETEMNSRLALAGFKQAQYDTQLQAEFSKAELAQRQADSRNQYNLSQQQMSQSAAQHRANIELQKQQMQEALGGADGLADQDRSMVQAQLERLQTGEITQKQFQSWAGTSKPSVRDFANEHMTNFLPETTEKKKKKTGGQISLPNYMWK